MEQRIVIQKKKRKAAAVFASVFVLGLSGLCIWVLIRFVFPELPGFLKFKIIATVVIAVVALVAVFFLIKQTFSNKPGLIIDENGITDYTNIASVGLIPWGDITAMKQAENELKRKLLVLMVKNPHSYIGKAASMQAARRVQNTQFGSPIVITVSNLDYDTNELVSLINSKISMTIH